MGDSRAGYYSKNNGWKSIITPINGEDLSTVVPITSDIWHSEKLINTYIESNIIKDDILAFTLLTDGCERFAFETYKWNEANQVCKSINLPFKDFYNPIIKYFNTLYSKTKSDKVLKKEWKNFLKNGTSKIENEEDDKTLILGFIHDEFTTKTF